MKRKTFPDVSCQPLFCFFVVKGLSKKQVSALWVRFQELDCDANGESKGYKGYIDGADLGRLPKFNENPIAKRLTDVILDDFGTNRKLSFNQFVDFMTIFGKNESHRHNRTSSYEKSPLGMKTDLETTKYSANDSAQLKKIKFIFRVNIPDDRFVKHWVRSNFFSLDVRRRPRRSIIEGRYTRDSENDGNFSLVSRVTVFDFVFIQVGKIGSEEASIIGERILAEFVQDQPNSTATITDFQEALKTLDINDKMSLKLLKWFQLSVRTSIWCDLTRRQPIVPQAQSIFSNK